MKYFLVLLVFIFVACGGVPANITATKQLITEAKTTVAAVKTVHGDSKTVIVDMQTNIDTLVKINKQPELTIPINQLNIDIQHLKNNNIQIDTKIINMDTQWNGIAANFDTIQADAKTAAVEAESNSERDQIRFWSIIALGLGIGAITASFFAVIPFLREIGYILFACGVIGSLLATYFKTIMLILFITFIGGLILILILVVMKVYQYKRAGLSIVESIQELFDTRLVPKTKMITDVLDKVQTPAAKALVDLAQSK